MSECREIRQATAPLDAFLASTTYTAPVDIKKLKFIFNAITAYASRSGKPSGALRILEIGCGSGGITLSLASLGCTVTAIDVDPAKAELVSRLAKQRGIGNLTVKCGDGASLSDGGRHDVVVVSEVLQYVPDPAPFIDSVGESMAAQAIAVVTVPNGYGPWEIKNRLSPIQRFGIYKWGWLRKILGKGPYVENTGEVLYRYYRRGEFTDLFLRAGFRLMHSGKSNSILAGLPLLDRVGLACRFDDWLADRLPYDLASGWYFVFEKS